MNNYLKEYYNLDVLGIIKITKKLYRIKTKDNKYYAFKYIDNISEGVFAHLSILDIDSFCLPIKNINGNYISKIDNDSFILLDWYDDELILAKELRLKFYFEELIKLHQISSYETKINKGYFEDIFLELEKKIDEEENDINYLLINIEKKEYKSPSEWLFLLNNIKFREALEKARKHLNKFKELVKDIDTIKVSLNYLNFDFSNVFIKDKKIIGIEKMKQTPIVYDVIDIFDKSYNLSIDIIMYLRLYFNEIRLLDFEKEWLLAMVQIPFIEINNKNEIDQIIEFSKTLYRLNRCLDLEKLLNNK